jgi:hypothetical protein
MGDHRASIEIVMKAHGKTYEQEWWINWNPDESTGCDRRITDWFSRCWEDAYERYHKRYAEYFVEQEAKRVEEEEKKELARLKEKYE